MNDDVSLPGNAMSAAVRALGILLLISAAACHDDMADIVEPEVPRLEDVPCRFPLANDQVVGTTVTCSDLVVYENRTAAESATIRLHVARYHGDQPEMAPVIYLHGGPGGTVAVLTPGLNRLAVGLLANGGDLIMFDQRGVGLSEPALDCPEVHEIGRQPDPASFAAAYTAAMAACVDRFADVVDLSAYNSAESAADVDELRRQFGRAQVDIVGTSYGTRLGLELLRSHSEGVRAAVLDSVLAPQSLAFVELPRNFHDAVSRLFAVCRADPACSAAYGDLDAALIEAIEGLNESPIELPTLGRTFTGYDFAMFLFNAMYSVANYPVIPALVTAAAAGDAAEVERILIERGVGQGGADTSSELMHHAVTCADYLRTVTQDEIDAAFVGVHPAIGDGFRDGVLTPYRAVCDLFPAGPNEAAHREPVVSDVRTLIMNGELDPITPARYGHAAAETLSRATVVDFPNTGHGSSGSSSCGTLIALGFLANPDAPPDTNCTAGIGVTFEPPGGSARRRAHSSASLPLPRPPTFPLPIQH